jgi:hypothetical protein
LHAKKPVGSKNVFSLEGKPKPAHNSKIESEFHKTTTILDRVAHNHKAKTFEISCPKETSNDLVNTMGPQVKCHMVEEVVLGGFSCLPNKSYAKLKQTKFFSICLFCIFWQKIVQKLNYF